MPVIEDDPESGSARVPKKGDKVIAAPHAPGCISGVVVSYTAQRLSVQTEGKHGVVHPEFSRFTWNAKKRAWICWPLDVVKEMKNLQRLDETPVRPNLGIAQVGEFVMLTGVGAGWVVKQITEPGARAEGMLFSKLKSYIVATAKGRVEVAAGNLTYNSDTRIWSGRANA